MCTYTDLTDASRPSPRAGFMLAPLLYMLALGGIGAAVMFSGYSQVLRSNAEMTSINAVRQQLGSASQTLSASSTLTSGNTILTPPSVTAFAAVTDTARLPSSYATVNATGTPTAYGVLDTATGVRQLDPWGKYYLYCKWDSAIATGTNPSISIISAGPDGTLQSKCGDNAAIGDDRINKLSVAEAINRANVWQVNSSSQVQFGNTAGAVKVDSSGSMNVDSMAVGSGATATSGNVYANGNVRGATMTSAGALTAGSISTGGTLSAGATSLSSLSLTSALSVANGGTSATTAAAARTNLGATVTGAALFTTESVGTARTTLGSTATGDALFTAASAAAARTTLGSTATGDALFTTASAAAARTTLGLGTMATQNANAVAITGGTISGVTITGSTMSGAATVAGSNGQVQFNNSGALGADSAFNWDNTNKRLGLGTATPARQLHLVGSGSSQPIGITLTDADAGGGSLYLGSNTGGTGAPGILAGSGFPLRLGANGSSTSMIITTDGNVGIGTASPVSHFQVGTGLGITWGNNIIINFNQYWDTISSTYESLSAGYGGMIWYDKTTGILHFGTGTTNTAAANENSNVNTSRLAIAPSGNVGIGTAAPTAKLEIQVPILGTTISYRLGDSPAYGLNTNIAGVVGGWARETSWGYAGSKLASMGAYGSDGVLSYLYLNANQSGAVSGHSLPSVVVTPAGKIGIGTTAPTQLLHVNGTAYATTFLHTSDRRLKTDISPIATAAQLTTKLRGVHFKWKKDGVPAYGVIAQEVEAVMPDAVTTNSDGTKAVDYDQLIPVLIEAVKALQVKVDALKRDRPQ